MYGQRLALGRTSEHSAAAMPRSSNPIATGPRTAPSPRWNISTSYHAHAPSTPNAMKPNWRSVRSSGSKFSSITRDMCSVRLELREVSVAIGERGAGLLRLEQHEALDHQRVDVRGHEAAICVRRRVHDRFAAHVEAGVDHQRAAGLARERADDGM